MANETWHNTLDLLIHSQDYDKWMQMMLFTAVIAGALTLFGIIRFLKKTGTESFNNIYMWLVISGSALVFAERSLRYISEKSAETVSQVGLYLWWASCVATVILFIWLLHQFYCNVWSKKAFNQQLLCILLLAIFQPGFVDQLLLQIYASPEERLYTVVQMAQFPRWDTYIRLSMKTVAAKRPSITNMSVILLYLAIWISFTVLLYKIMKQVEFKKTRQKTVDKIIKYGMLVPLYFCPVQTILLIGILPFTFQKEEKEKKKEEAQKSQIMGKVRKW